MHAVYGDSSLAQNSGQMRIAVDRHLMCEVVVGMLRPTVVLEGTRNLRGNILVEGAPTRHVEYLDAPADSENRQALS